MPEINYSERIVSSPSIGRLIPLMQKAAESNHIAIKPQLAKDPHFWYLTARSYATHSERVMDISKLTFQYVNKDMRKSLAFVDAISESTTRYAVEQLAAKDSLTGASNRGALDEYLLRLLQHSRSDSLDIVAMLDIDHFKKINDEFGHVCGDHVLQNLVKILFDATRGIDMVARYGGEEFVLVMPERAHFEPGWEQKCLSRIEIIRKKIEKELATMVSKTSGHEIKGPITASFGVIALGPAARPELSWVYGEVDHYLYAAKNSGRNRIESSLMDYI